MRQRMGESIGTPIVLADADRPRLAALRHG